MTVPTVPDLMKDFCASNEQTDVCKRRCDFAMAGASSMTGAVIKSWSTEQRGYHARDRARLRKFSNDILRRTNQMINGRLVLEEGWETIF
jgi:hypothetical protein